MSNHLERVSSGWTLVLKIFLPVFWFVFFFSFGVALWFVDESQLGTLQTNSFRIPYSVVFALFVIFFYLTIWRLNRIEVGKNFIYVYTYFRNARYPFHNIKKIREYNLGIFYVGKIVFKIPGKLGNNLFFIQSRKRHQKVMTQNDAYREVWVYDK